MKGVERVEYHRALYKIWTPSDGKHQRYSPVSLFKHVYATEYGTGYHFETLPNVSPSHGESLDVIWKKSIEPILFAPCIRKCKFCTFCTVQSPLWVLGPPFHISQLLLLLPMFSQIFSPVHAIGRDFYHLAAKLANPVTFEPRVQKIQTRSQKILIII